MNQAYVKPGLVLVDTMGNRSVVTEVTVSFGRIGPGVTVTVEHVDTRLGVHAYALTALQSAFDRGEIVTAYHEDDFVSFINYKAQEASHV